MKISAIKAVLFDLDGVLIDSESKYTEIWEEIERHFPTGIPDFARKIKGTTLPDILSRHFPEPQVRAKVTDMLYDLEGRMHYDYTPGAFELLELLRAKKVPVALVTSSDEMKMQHLWDQHPEMKPFFNAIITSEKVTRSKPDPQPYLIAARELGIPAEDSAVVEDSLQGVKAGKAAGAMVVGVVGTLDAETLAPHADLLVTSLTHLAPLFV